MSIDPKELARVVSRADQCHGTVTREGKYDVCGKPPVAIIYSCAEDDEGYWPACAWHVNRFGPGVPLSEVVAALRQVDIAGLRRAMLGTEDGDLIAQESEVPAGEMFRLAVEWLRAQGAVRGVES